MCINDTFRRVKIYLVASIFVSSVTISSVLHAQNTNIEATICAVGAISGVVLVANSQNSQSLQISGSVTQAPYVDVFLDGQKQTRILISGNESDFFTTVSISPGNHVVRAYIYDACTQQDLISEVAVTVSGSKEAPIAALNKPESFVISKNMQRESIADRRAINESYPLLSIGFIRDIFTIQDEKEHTLWQYVSIFFIGAILIMYSLYLFFSCRLWKAVNYTKGKNKKILFKRCRIRASLSALFGVVFIAISLVILV